MAKEKFTVRFSKTAGGADVTVLSGVPYFSAAQTFDCGQCFRFDEVSGGIEGVAHGRFIRIEEEGGEVRLIGVNEQDYRAIFEEYLGLCEDYGVVREDIGAHMGKYGDVIFNAMECGKGIRILKQEPWEAVASFIISQNNNIPRIKKIIENMSAGLGEPFCGFDGKTHYAFPTAEQVLAAGEAGLAPFKMGFRARYLIDAAKKHLSGEVDFAYVEKASAEDAQKALMSICGVGPKVASCALLFGFHKLEFFPIDVWIKRVLAKYYPGGIDIASLGAYAGVAQQYLFYYERYMGGEE
ncbi:MAG: DNA-3-methyladenine glycosylase 2 family protein [Clostridia bacterium]|nr:DNA-3-methyladenine glycosylase 2 family protein [Clostridia bacterium]